MKKKFQIMALVILTIAFASCEKHDFFDENTITGAVGPEAYWEIESSAVKAGGEMGFTAQYYSSVSKIDHSEVWYSLDKTIAKTVNCSWLTHSYISSIKSEERVLQFIKEFPHLEEYRSDSLHAYTFAGTFPVSGTLAPVAWVRPTEFDSTKMATYFGENFMKEFKDAVSALGEEYAHAVAYIGDDTIYGSDEDDILIGETGLMIICSVEMEMIIFMVEKGMIFCTEKPGMII